MVSKHFLTASVLGFALLVGGPGVNLFAGGHGGGGGGHGGGGGGHGGGYGHGGYGGGYGHGGYGGGYGYGRGYGYGGFYGGFYGGGLFYGDYLTGGGYPGYYAPNVYSPPAYYYYPDPGVSYASPRGSYTAPTTAYYYAPSAPTTTNSASIHVVLPDPQAKVQFDGNATTSTGSERYYHTPELAPGGSYQYKLRVSWMQDGTQVSQERTVSVTPGKTAEVVFARTVSQNAPAISSVVK
jgi:uncharacterized protein (TIGR03000 family)